MKNNLNIVRIKMSRDRKRVISKRHILRDTKSFWHLETKLIQDEQETGMLSWERADDIVVRDYIIDDDDDWDVDYGYEIYY